MNIALYVNRKTCVHSLDGRTKVFMAVGFCVLALCFSHPLYLGGIVGGIIFLLGKSEAFSNIKKMWVLTTLLFWYSVILWPVFVEGATPIPYLHVAGVTEEGLMVGCGMGLRLVAMIWAGVWLLSVITVEDLAAVLSRLGLPGRVAFAFSLAFRWVAILLGAGIGVVQAQRSRGLDTGSGGLLARFPKYVPLVVPIIGQALRQTNALAMALESKGFHPSAERHHTKYPSLRMRDYVVCLFLGVSIGVALWMRTQGVGILDIRF